MEKQGDKKERSERAKLAIEYFKKGYNCTQSVFVVFAKEYGLSEELALRISASFGAGMGRMREVCGTVSGMNLVAGLETGATDGSAEGKKQNYEMVQHLAGIFREKHGSIICKELLGLVPAGQAASAVRFTDTTPAARTEQYYKKRPCMELIADAVEILEDSFAYAKK